MHSVAQLTCVACKLLAALDSEIPRGAACAALADVRSVHSPHAERPGSRCGRLKEARGLVWCSMLFDAHMGRSCRLRSAVEDEARQVAVGPWRTATNHFYHDFTEAS